MRLPGTRYQEPGWEEVRKLLGQCSLVALRAAGAGALGEYVDLAGDALHALRHSARARAPGNAYGDSVFELALALLYELQARPGDWAAFCAALDHAPAAMPEALLRKKVNDLYAVLRDKVDADNYQAACGRPCSANRMYAYRMLDTAHGEIARLFAAWRAHREQVGAILGRELADGVEPIEVRQLRGAASCRPEWIVRWSATLERYGAGPGPLHTRSKRFEGMNDNVERIGAMLAEIGEYEVLSANRDAAWLQDHDDASAWVDDFWRVLQESEAATTPGPDRILEAREDALDGLDDAPEPAPPLLADPGWEAAAVAVALPPGYGQAAAAASAGDGPLARLLAQDGLAVQLAAYARLLGPADESYPDAWRDPATGALPTMQQLAGLAGVSLPTLRKRRDAALARLEAHRGRIG